MIHGELDYRVPATQGLQYFNSLKAKDVAARLVYFPDENHWILKPQNSQLWYREFFAWLARFAPAKRGAGVAQRRDGAATARRARAALATRRRARPRPACLLARLFEPFGAFLARDAALRGRIRGEARVGNRDCRSRRTRRSCRRRVARAPARRWRARPGRAKRARCRAPPSRRRPPSRRCPPSGCAGRRGAGRPASASWDGDVGAQLALPRAQRRLERRRAAPAVSGAADESFIVRHYRPACRRRASAGWPNALAGGGGLESASHRPRDW